jgi:hypothetical protein
LEEGLAFFFIAIFLLYAERWLFVVEFSGALQLLAKMTALLKP